MIDKWFYIFWLAPKVLLMFVIVALVMRNLWREFPYFLSYMIFQLLETVLILILRHRIAYPSYFYFFWFMEAVGVVSVFLVINEIFRSATKPYTALQRLSKVLFQWALIVILMVAIAITIYAPPMNDPSRLIASIITIKRIISIIEVGLLAFLFLFIRAFAIPWRKCIFGITLGFVLYGSAELAMFAARIHWGGSVDNVLNWSLILVNNCTVTLWVAYFVFPRSEQVSLTPVPGNQLQQWNEALREIWQ